MRKQIVANMALALILGALGCSHHAPPAAVQKNEPSWIDQPEAAAVPPRPTTDQWVRPATLPAFHVSDMAVRTSDSQTFFYVSNQTTFRTMQGAVESSMADLLKAAASGRVKFTGPSAFIYHGASPQELERPFSLEIGFPVADGTRPFGRFRVEVLAPFHCAAVQFTGPLSRIDKAYDKLIPAIEAAHLKPTDEVREIFAEFNGSDSPDNDVTVAIGVEEPGSVVPVPKPSSP